MHLTRSTLGIRPPSNDDILGGLLSLLQKVNKAYCKYVGHDLKLITTIKDKESSDIRGWEYSTHNATELFLCPRCVTYHKRRVVVEE